MMEEKLIIGGEVISRASKQEGLLRKAEQELRERQQQETRLARELAEKEEANLQLEGSACFACCDCTVLYHLAYVVFAFMTELYHDVLFGVHVHINMNYNSTH
jgi:hypothetical protein